MKKGKKKVKSAPASQENKKTVPASLTNGKIASLKKKKFGKKKKKSEKATALSEEEDIGRTTDQVITHGDTSIVKCNVKGVKSQPVISKDSKYILCPCGVAVAVFRRKSGALENFFTQHKYDVTDVHISKRNPAQAISCSSREVIVWEYADLTLVKRWDLSFAAVQWYVDPRSQEEIYFKRKIDERSHKMELVKLNLATEEQEVLGSVSKIDKCVAVSSNGGRVVFAYKQDLKIHPTWAEPVHSGSHITCVTFHPSAESIVCTGHKNGKITVWYKVSEKMNHVRVKLHWHYTPFADMVFSNDGNYLYSGGKEGVLVVWQLETQTKTFLPHLGSGIRHLAMSTDDQFIIVTLRNNMIKIISATTSKLSKTIKFLSQAYEVPAGLTYHSVTDCLVLNGNPDGVVQFYQPRTDNVELSEDLIGENLIIEYTQRYVYPTRIMRIAFSDDGLWMATVEEREDRLLPTERRLKFWMYKDSKYTLNTTVDPPHRGSVHSLCFRPFSGDKEHMYMALTTSDDGEVKTWSLTSDQTEDSAPLWQIHLVGSYGSNVCSAASFSHDGKSVAVLFGAVTIWNTDTLSLERCLEFNANDETIIDIKYSHNESSDFLIGRSANYIVVWNTKTNSVAWMLNVDVSLIISDRYSRYCAAFIRRKQGEKTTDLYLFDPVSPAPKCLLQNVLNNTHSAVSHALFTPRVAQKEGEGVWTETGQLYILTDQTEIYAVKAGDDETVVTFCKDEVVEENKEKSEFEGIFGSVLKENGGDEEDMTGDQVLGQPSVVFIRKMLSTPANVLPSTDVLCKAYVKTLLLPRPCSTEENVPMDTNEKHGGEEKMVTDESCNDELTPESLKAVVYTPSKSLVKKLRRFKFDFVQPIT